MRACFVAVADGCDELRLDSSDLRLLANLVGESGALLDQIGRAHLLHGDLIPGNVMVDPDEPSRGVIGIFDCDRVCLRLRPGVVGRPSRGLDDAGRRAAAQ